MNSGDCYVLITPSAVFNWQGRFSNVIERSRSAEVAACVFQKKDMGCKTASNVQTIEEDKMVNCSRENRRFWKTLTGKEEVGEVAPAGPPEEDEVSVKQYVSPLSCQYYCYSRSTRLPSLKLVVCTRSILKARRCYQ